MAELGIDLIGAAKAAAGAFLPGIFGPEGNGAPGVMPAPEARTGPGTPSTSVSPAIQTQISPQISPVMTQMQASPGAGVQAAPSMYPGGAQSAMPMGVPGLPPPPMGPPQPVSPYYGGYGMGPQPMPWGMPSAFQTGEQRINWTTIAIVGAAAIAAIAVFGGRRRKRSS